MLTIANFRANYFVPEGAPDRAAVRTRLDRLVLHRLPAEMGGHLSPPPADEAAVYRIRHLEIDLWIDALGMSDGQIARSWSRLILQAVARTLMAGLPGQVIRLCENATGSHAPRWHAGRGETAAAAVDTLSGRCVRRRSWRVVSAPAQAHSACR